jgi:hypothetical protein
MSERRVTPEDDLRVALAPDDTIAPLDPARVIAGARRRRKVRALATAGVASVAVIGIAAGGFLAASGSLDNAPQPADPGVIDPTVDSTPRTSPTPQPSYETPSATPAPPTGQTAGSTATPPTVADCLQEAAATGDPGPGSAAKQLASLDGRLIVVADSKYWMACDTTVRPTPTARKPAKLMKPSVQDSNAFAVANNEIETAAGRRDFFWAAGMLPDGVATVRYSFVDGAVVDAEVSNGFWMMRHVSTVPPGVEDLGSRVRVQLLSRTGAVLNDVRLNWGTQTCAQISHGC